MYDEIPCYMVERGKATRKIRTVCRWEERNGKTISPTGSEGSSPAARGKDRIAVLAMEETDVVPVTNQELIEEQGNDPLGKILTEQLGETGKPFKLDQNGHIVRRSWLEGSLQKKIPRSLRQRILYLPHNPRLT